MHEIKRIHHIAVLVKDMDASLGFWHDILGIKPSHVTDVPSEAAKVAFLPVGESEVELVQPTSTGTGLTRYLEKHGPGMHHLCLEVTDLRGLLLQLKSKQVQLINEEPKIDEAGRLYAFIHPKSTFGVLVELYQIPR
jgi:methylmalonyl-CoA/ethylmalonyl-CoA epimerase